MAEKEAYHKLLLQRKELMFKLLRLSKDTALTEPEIEQNVENYIRLVEAREEIIVRLIGLDIELDFFGEPPDMLEKSFLLSREIKEMAKQITRLESDIRSKASGIINHLQREIRSTNDRKKAGRSDYTPGTLFESKA